MSRKIAPMLQLHNLGPNTCACDEHYKARAELRALLAVARAAWRVEGLNGGAANDALSRALARLDKVSGRKP